MRALKPPRGIPGAWRAVLAIGLAAISLAVAPPSVARASTFLVNLAGDAPDFNPADGRCDVDFDPNNGNLCSLRAAIQQANAFADADVIVVPGGTFRLTRTGQGEDAASTGDLDVTGPLTIQGANTLATFLEAGTSTATAIDRILDVRPGAVVVVRDLHLRRGKVTGDGGVIRNNGTLTLERVKVSEGEASGFGGGIGSSGAGDAMTIRDGVVADNRSTGGPGIGGGGGIRSGGPLTIERSAIVRNAATEFGGGVRSTTEPSGAQVSILHTTISDNTSPRSSGLFLESPLTVTLTRVTIADNSPSEPAAVATTPGPTVTLTASILRNAGTNCRLPNVTSGGGNVSSDDSCGSGPGDVRSVDPKLGPLAERTNATELGAGGRTVRTETRPLLPGSPAIDAVSGAAPACGTTDQRGLPAVIDGNEDGQAGCDAGAFELQRFAVNRTNDAPGTPGSGTCDVDSTVAGPDCTLRSAIRAANEQGSAAVVLGPSVHTLAVVGRDEDAALTGDLDVTGGVALFGATPAATVVEAGPAPTGGVDRVFEVRPGGVLALSGVSVRHGSETSGGGITNRGTLTLARSVVTANQAVAVSSGNSNGGGIHNVAGATLDVRDTTLSGNVVQGGAIGFGGGLFNDGTATLLNVTISGNVVQASTVSAGGGTFESGTLQLSFVSLIDNRAGSGGGGIIVQNDGSPRLRGTLLANAVGGNCAVIAGGLQSDGSNLSSDTSCAAVLTAPSDRNNLAPLLGPLAVNDGPNPVPTHALLPGSPAIDAVSDVTPVPGVAVLCPPTDARGNARPQDGDGNGSAGCDVGAFEQADRCQPRPRVQVAVVPIGGGRIRATIRATTNPGTTTNLLRTLRFAPVRGGLLDGLGLTGSPGNTTVDLPGGRTEVQFEVRPLAAGQRMTAPLVVVDDCGEWRTFVGAGTNITSVVDPTKDLADAVGALALVPEVTMQELRR